MNLTGILSILFLTASLLLQAQIPIKSDKAVVVLGVAQDAGHPQADCQKKCCAEAWLYPGKGHQVVSLGLVDITGKKFWMMEATPDFKNQLQLLRSFYPGFSLEGIFITHGHIGHYTGLMDLGREAMGAKSMPVYVMPRMATFLRENGPWSQLVSLENIKLSVLKQNIYERIGAFMVKPFLVDHRDEYTETVGYEIRSDSSRIVFVPDIDSWKKLPVASLVRRNQIALLDATFYDQTELPNRDISEIPHPLVIQSMEALDALSPRQKSGVHFIHMNHTNPLLDKSSQAFKDVKAKGFNVAEEGQIFYLK